MTTNNDNPGGNKKVALSVADELAIVELEFKREQLEQLRRVNERAREEKENFLRALREQQRTIDENNRKIMADQSICKHRKGGKNLGGIVKGNDDNYSLLKHTYPWGQSEITCSRCNKQVREPLGLNFGTVKKDHVPPKEIPLGRIYALPSSKPFKEAMAAFLEWDALPTDNEPSGTTMFKFERVA